MVHLRWKSKTSERAPRIERFHEMDFWGAFYYKGNIDPDFGALVVVFIETILTHSLATYWHLSFALQRSELQRNFSNVMDSDISRRKDWEVEPSLKSRRNSQIGREV